MNRKKFTLCLLVTGFAALAIWFGIAAAKHPDPPAPPARRVVKLYRVGTASAPSGISYPGRVNPVRHAELFFRVSGPVIERNLKYGQTVEANDVLMRIDPRDYQREVDRLTQELNMQRVQCALAETEYQRNRKLLASQAVSQAVYDTAKTKKEAADAQFGMLEVSLKIARDRLADTVLRAPFHGTVSELKIEQYEIAHANVPVVQLDDLRTVEIKISIPAGNLPDISIYNGKEFLGRAYNVTFPGRGDRVFRAQIYEFKPVASETSETYEVTLRMDVPNDFLVLPGMSAEVHGLPSFHAEQPGQPKLPFAAIFNRDNQSAVWVYHPDSGKLEKRAVTAGKPADADTIFVTGDLKAGDLVVAAGGDWLTASTPVEILNPEALHANH